jgi:hypothetical protein
MAKVRENRAKHGMEFHVLKELRSLLLPSGLAWRPNH